MADIEFNSDTGRANLYIRISDNLTDKFWNGSSFVTWVDANVATYAVAVPEIGGGRYGVAVPAGITAPRTLSIALYDNASPAITDKPEGEGIADWLGTRLQPRTIGFARMI